MMSYTLYIIVTYIIVNDLLKIIKKWVQNAAYSDSS